MPRRRRHRLDADARAKARDEAIAQRARRAVLRRHARLQPSGDPVFCTPSRDELANDALRKAPPGTDFRPIFDTHDAAEAAAREFEELGSRPLRPFVCPRSPHRHHLHLTTDRSPATKRRTRAAQEASHGQ